MKCRRETEMTFAIATQGPLGRWARSAALAASLAGTTPLFAEDGPKPVAAEPKTTASALQKKLSPLAVTIANHLKLRKLNSVAVGAFTAPSRLASSGGIAISRALSDELKKLGIEIQRKATHEVKGEFIDVTDDATGRQVLQIIPRFCDDKGILVADADRVIIEDPTLFAVLTGATIDAQAKDTPQPEQPATVKPDVPKLPHVEANTRVFASKDSPFAIEVLVMTNGQFLPRKVEVDADGFSFVSIQPGEKYSIRLVNKSDNDASVVLTIDGINVFQFTEVKGYNHWIVPRGDELQVRGWHRTNQLSNEFEISKYPDTVAAQAISNGASLGTITATFAAAWPVGQKPPADEVASKGEEEQTPRALGTKRGSEVNVSYGEVNRHVGRMRASVSVRYDKTVIPKDLPTVVSR